MKACTSPGGCCRAARFPLDGSVPASSPADPAYEHLGERGGVERGETLADPLAALGAPTQVRIALLRTYPPPNLIAWTTSGAI
jgi:hypothetical protein